MGRVQRAEDALMTRMVKEGSRKGVTRFGKVADKLKRPPAWGAIAAAMAAAGPRSRRAAVRGSACYASAALAHLPIKALVGRKHPPRSSKVARVGPVTSSFPSGHAASEFAFALGAAQELPLLLIPLYAATAASEWSLLRARSHYPSDVLAGAALAVGVAVTAWKLWPPVRGEGPDATPDTPEVDDDRSSRAEPS
jgi:membrane-associated phospholipid phosphatase